MKPAFSFVNVESKYLIHESQSEIVVDGVSYKSNGQVWLELLPRATILINGSFQGLPIATIMDISSSNKKITSFRINGNNVDGFLLNAGGDITKQELTVKWAPHSEPVAGIGGEPTQMTEIVFHLFNFVEWLGTNRSVQTQGSGSYSIDHVSLLSKEWKIELQSLVETRDNFKQLRAEGGYRLTHIGSIKKADGNIFSGKEASEILGALRLFLSFAKGGYCVPVCPVGYDASGNRVWETWSSPYETWRNPQTWFDRHHSQQLTDLWKCFADRRSNEGWREALDESIYWYLNANHSSRGIDAGIILTQAAIERLSYEFAVEDKRLLTAKGFKDLWASDKFRLLFSSLGIPIDIPAETPELQKLAKQFSWIDAPHALTEVRNSLVHPDHKHRGKFDPVFYEAWNLGLWYLEMGVLAICNYKGTYGNRLKMGRWVGDIDNVPY